MIINQAPQSKGLHSEKHKIMPKKQTDPKAIDGAVHENSDPTREEVNELLNSFDEEKATRRIDVLEDMLDIMNER